MGDWGSVAYHKQCLYWPDVLETKGDLGASTECLVRWMESQMSAKENRIDPGSFKEIYYYLPGLDYIHHWIYRMDHDKLRHKECSYQLQTQ